MKQNKNALVLRALTDANTIITNIYKNVDAIVQWEKSPKGKRILEAIGLLISEKPVYGETPMGLTRYSETFYFIVEYFSEILKGGYAAGITSHLNKIRDEARLPEYAQSVALDFELKHSNEKWEERDHIGTLEEFLVARLTEDAEGFKIINP